MCGLLKELNLIPECVQGYANNPLCVPSSCVKPQVRQFSHVGLHAALRNPALPERTDEKK